MEVGEERGELEMMRSGLCGVQSAALDFFANTPGWIRVCYLRSYIITRTILYGETELFCCIL